MRAIRILVCACGTPGTAALVRALRENGERDVHLVGVDMAENVVGRHLCDAFRRVPPGSSPLFAAAVVELCRAERIDVVLPQSSGDLLALAEAKAQLAAEGVAVLVASPETVRLANDKAASYERLDEIGVRIPAWRRARGGRELGRAATELGYPALPVCVEPSQGSGSHGFRILDAFAGRRRDLLRERPDDVALRLEEAVEALPEVGGEELLVMELLEGQERAVDGIAVEGRVALGYPKTREPDREGVATYFETLVDDNLVDVARRVADAFRLEHFFNIQLVGEAVVEVNPRISTVVYQEDLNLSYLGVKHAIGEIDADELASLVRRVRPTRRALRYYDQVEWDDDGARERGDD